MEAPPKEVGYVYLLACLANDESHFSSKADNARTRPLLFIQQRHVLDEWSRYFGEKWRLKLAICMQMELCRLENKA